MRFFTIEKWGQKQYLKKLWMYDDKTWWMSWLDDKNKRIRFWFRLADLAHRWDTKRKLFSQAEGCTPPSAVVVEGLDYNIYRIGLHPSIPISLTNPPGDSQTFPIIGYSET